jgi:hypothetical protein
MNRPFFNEIVFLDDFFRSDENGLQSHPVNRRFLRGLFSSACRSLGIAAREECPVSDGGAIPIAEIMGLLGLPLTKEGWAGSVIADLEPAFSKLDVLKLERKSLVIGWGLAPSLLKYIDSRGATFIDVEVHSLRFSRHLHLGVRTNCKKIAAIFSRIKVPDEVFEGAAIGIKALFSRRGDNALFCRDSRVGIFLGQTEVDLALVSNGKLVSPRDVAEKVAELATSVDILAIKPHPYQGNTTLLDDLMRLPNAIKVERNMYAMLCADNAEFVAGISSGALAEAEFFGCRKERLAEQDRNNATYLPKNCTDWIPVGSEIASLPVMRDIVGRSYFPFFLTPKRNYKSVISAANSDLLDQAFGVRWGLQLDAAGLRCSPRVALNEGVRFESGSSYADALNSGWHEPEAWGVWSAEDNASLLLVLDTATLPCAGQVQVVLTGSLYRPEGSASVGLTARISGKSCQVMQSDGLSVSILCNFEAQELRAKPLLLIDISVQGAHRPCDVSNSTDSRRLGLGLHLLTAVALDDSQADIGLVESGASVDWETAAMSC